MHTLPVFHCEYQTYPSLVVVRTLRVDSFVCHNVFEGVVHVASLTAMVVVGNWKSIADTPIVSTILNSRYK
jgi:hypothetical protein